MVAATATSFEETPPDAGEMAERVRRHPADKPWLVAEADGAVGGYAYASVFRARRAYRFGAEVTCYVASAAQRSGTGRRLYTALLALLRAQGYRRAFAGITLPNAASVGFHEALGFTPVGTFPAAGYKLGRWHDVAFFGLTLRPLDDPDHDPLPRASLDAEAVRRALNG